MKLQTYRGRAFHFERFGIVFTIVTKDPDNRHMDIVEAQLTDDQHTKVTNAYDIVSDGSINHAAKSIGRLIP